MADASFNSDDALLASQLFEVLDDGDDRDDESSSIINSELQKLLMENTLPLMTRILEADLAFRRQKINAFEAKIIEISKCLPNNLRPDLGVPLQSETMTPNSSVKQDAATSKYSPTSKNRKLPDAKLSSSVCRRRTRAKIYLGKGKQKIMNSGPAKSKLMQWPDQAVDPCRLSPTIMSDEHSASKVPLDDPAGG